MNPTDKIKLKCRADAVSEAALLSYYMKNDDYMTEQLSKKIAALQELLAEISNNPKGDAA